MRASDLQEELKRQPFRPFRLYLTDGTAFDVAHPELAVVSHSAVRLRLPPALGLGLERDALIDLLHIMWLEVLNVPGPTPPGGGNGPASPPA
jgi:hypothetical protein